MTRNFTGEKSKDGFYRMEKEGICGFTGSGALEGGVSKLDFC